MIIVCCELCRIIIIVWNCIMSYVDVFLTKQVMQPYWSGSHLNKRESIGIED